MMLVGDRGRFAIEYELDRLPGGSAGLGPGLGHWMFGRIRWWCGGEKIGRYQPNTAIRDVAAAAERILLCDGARRSPALMALPAPEVAHIVTAALFADDDRSDEQIAADGARYWPFFVGPRTESFEPWDIFVVEDDLAARLIWGQAGLPEVRERGLRRGEFAGVLRDFLGTLEWGDRQ
ncbi:Imm42 family immunity protein [Nocardia sp. NPDC006630]|uniref:Imm42 family immunity protein n=1 Tax=Nocardia sp. NPDC006630 TaxID=3157181 RepID=UPI0033B664F1